MAIEAEALLARLEAKAQEQIDYWRKRKAAEKALEDGVSEDGMSYTPMGDHTAWQAGYCNGRMSEADWWLQTLTLEIPDLIRSALAEDTARAAEDMRERCAEVALSLRHERSGEWHDASRDRAIGRRNRVLAEVAATIRALPLDKEAADANR